MSPIRNDNGFMDQPYVTTTKIKPKMVKKAIVCVSPSSQVASSAFFCRELIYMGQSNAPAVLSRGVAADKERRRELKYLKGDASAKTETPLTRDAQK